MSFIEFPSAQCKPTNSPKLVPISFQASKEIDRTPGEILQELFPCRLRGVPPLPPDEARGRSANGWSEQHGIQISQPTISRAASRNPKMFEDWFTENIEPTARRIVSSLDVSMTELLFDDSDNAAYHVALAVKMKPRRA